MITLSVPIAAHVLDDPLYAPHFIELDGVVVHYWTDAPIDLTWNGHVWSHASPFIIGDIVTDASGQQLVSVRIDDEALIVAGYDLNEGMRDRTVTIWRAFISPADGTTVLDAQVVGGPGTTKGIDFDVTSELMATLTITPAFEGTSQTGPRETYQLNCANVFKGTRCKYVGILTTCDHTYTDCTAHTNQPNFRGCRHATLPGKIIQWGGGTGVTLNPNSFNASLYPPNYSGGWR